MRRMFAGLLLTLISSLCVAQAATATATAQAAVSWTAPTTGSAGTVPLVGTDALTSYNVYLSTAPLTAVPATPTVTVGGAATGATGSITVVSGQTVYAYVTACNAQGCSSLSAAGTAVAQLPAVSPDPPTNVTIQITVTWK